MFRSLLLVVVILFAFTSLFSYSKNYLDAKQILDQKFVNPNEENIFLLGLKKFDLKENEKVLLDNYLQKKEPILPFVVNIFFGSFGVGNFIQGDINGGLSQLKLTGLNLLGIVLSSALVVIGTSSYNDGAIAVGGIFYIVFTVFQISNYVIGLVRPFTYYKALENRYYKLISYIPKKDNHYSLAFDNNYSRNFSKDIDLRFSLAKF